MTNSHPTVRATTATAPFRLLAILLIAFSAWQQCAIAAEVEFELPAIPAVCGGQNLEVRPEAIFLGRDLSSRRAGRILVVDLRIANVGSAPVAVDFLKAEATVNGQSLPTVESLKAFRNTQFEYFDSIYRIMRDADTAEPFWRVTITGRAGADDVVLPDDLPTFGPRDRFVPDDEPLLDAPPAGSTNDGTDLAVEDLHSPAATELSPGESTRAILSFRGFDENRTAPSVLISWPGLETPIDLAGWSTKRAKVTTSRLGPRDCIGIVHIRGPVDRLGMSAVSEAMDRLSVDDVRRSVLSFEDGSAVSERILAQWLRLSVVNETTSAATYRDIAALSSSMLDVSVADEANVIRPLVGRAVAGAEGAIVESVDQAIAVVAESVVSRLERDDVIEELTHGTSNGFKAAILTSAAYRLRPRDLSVVLALADSPSPEVRVAAMKALGQFDVPEAADRLRKELASESPLVRREAVLALLTIGKTGDNRVLDELAAAVHDDPVGLGPLADEPVEAWRPVFETAFASGEGDLRSVGVRGLINLGGSEAREAIAKVLVGPNDTVKQLVVQELTEWDDVTWATEIALEQLRLGKCDEQLLDLLQIEKPRECLRPLLAQLPTMPQSQAIRAARLIGALADPKAEAELTDAIDRLEQGTAFVALDILFERRADGRFDAVQKLLASADKNTERRLISLLGRDGSPEAEKIICDQFIASEDKSAWAMYKSQLEQMGGPQAHQTIREILTAENDEKKAFAHDARAQLWVRSPAFRVMAAALDLQKTRTEESFLEAEKLFTKASDLDPENASVLNSRGMLYLQWPTGGRLDDALTDYEAARTIAPFYGSANVGLALAHAAKEQSDEAVQAIAEIPGWLRGQIAIDEYNIACTYGVLHQKLSARTSLTEQDQAQAEQWKADGLQALEKSIELGFCSGQYGTDNLQHMQTDPDLLSIHGPRFDELVKRASQRDDG